MNPAMREVIGIDGGGTSTRAALFRVNEDAELGEIIRTASSGSANINSTSIDSVRTHFKELIDKLAPENLFATGLGVAGLSSPNAKEILQEILLDLNYSNNIVIKGDHEIALRGAFSRYAGILLIAGTGSIAVAQTSSSILRTGGYGYLLDDEGSAFDIGRQLLMAFIKAQDMRRVQGPMLLALEDELLSQVNLAKEAINSQSKKKVVLEKIMNLAYAKDFDKAKIANLSKVFATFLERGDSLAEKIAENVVESLAQLVRGIFSQSSETFGKIVFAGGVLEKNEIICTRLESKLSKEFPMLKRVKARAGQVYGAADFAVEEYLCKTC